MSPLIFLVLALAVLAGGFLWWRKRTKKEGFKPLRPPRIPMSEYAAALNPQTTLLAQLPY